jgi:uncharacterized membrane protein (UPF0127 family)
MAWLMRDGAVLAALEVSDTRADRVRGLVGRSAPQGALLLRRPLLLHTMTNGFGVDVAFCDQDLRVLNTVLLRRARVAAPWRRGRRVLIGPEGAFERWHLLAGDQLEVNGT